MIRPARPSDLHQLRFLAQTAFAPYANRIRGRREPLSADLRELVMAGRISVFVVANAIRGFVCYYTDGPDVHIEALAVGNKFRRRGVGRQLLDKADREGLRAGCRRAIFYTNAQMFENIAYFRAKGFQEVDRRLSNGFERVVLERYLR
ncbi:MAG: GNAT family N-acetyltransferase [Pseudomonadota bacterium]